MLGHTRRDIIRRSILRYEVGLANLETGGYVDHPDDPGGETKWGISKRSYPDLDIASLSLETAITIYGRDFWPPHLNQLDDHELVEYLFRMAINIRGNHRTATKCAQRAFNDLGLAQRIDVPGTLSLTETRSWRLKVDGLCGPLTREALNTVYQWHETARWHGADTGEQERSDEIVDDVLRLGHFHIRLRRHATMQYLAVSGVRHPFLRGWVDRAMGLA